MSRKASYIKGVLGEYYALLYLRLKGYHLVSRRQKPPVGEVDLVVIKRKTSRRFPIHRSDTLILVEVKVRKNIQDALYAISEKQKIRYTNAGKYIYKKYSGVNIRYDAVLISGVKIKYIENAWI